jgi:hypothetical protein
MTAFERCTIREKTHPVMSMSKIESFMSRAKQVSFGHNARVVCLNDRKVCMNNDLPWHISTFFETASNYEYYCGTNPHQYREIYNQLKHLAIKNPSGQTAEAIHRSLFAASFSFKQFCDLDAMLVFMAGHSLCITQDSLFPSFGSGSKCPSAQPIFGA